MSADRLDVPQSYSENLNLARLLTWGEELEKAVKVFLYIAAAGFLALGGYQLFLDHSASGTVAIVGGLACLFVGKLDLFEQIEIFALKATMKRTITEAQVTVQQVQNLGAKLSTVTLRLLATTGWWDGAHSRRDKAELKQSILNTLKELGLPDDQFRAVSDADASYVRYEYVEHLKLSGSFVSSHPHDAEKWTAFLSQTSNRRITNPPSPTEFDDFFRTLETPVPPGVLELLEDYRHYFERGVHRRPEDFFAKYPGSSTAQTEALEVEPQVEGSTALPPIPREHLPGLVSD